jgi:hypothetical protein
MAFSEQFRKEIQKVLDQYLEKARPSEELRHKIDLGYRVDGQSIIIYELQEVFDEKEQMIECPAAKATWVKSKNLWKVYWMRADLKWHPFRPVPFVKTIRHFVTLVESDPYNCFWG